MSPQPPARAVDRVDEHALVIRLHVLEIVAELGRRLACDRDELVERRGAVVLRFPFAQQIQIRSRQQQDRRHCLPQVLRRRGKALRTAPRSGSSTFRFRSARRART
jgi:hypothetical protein